MSDDYTATILTTGTVAVGGASTGEIEIAGDRDWFAVELVAGRTYQFDLRGSPTGDGTLSDTFLRRILDAQGNKSHGDGSHRTYNDDFGSSVNSRVTFTATESGTYYIETSGDRDETGTYTLEVTDVTPAADPDAERAGATDLGDITGLEGARFPTGSLDGDGDNVDYYRFTLTEAKEVGLGLRQQDANADLFLEDAEGTVLHSSVEAGTANEAIWQTLLAGTYYVRVEAQEAGQNDYVFRYGVSAADSDEVTRLERQQQGANEAPAFAEQSYAFDLTENADGSTNAIALGTVSATDPENAALTYSIEGGNEARLFEIDAANGALSYTGAGEDYESGTTNYQLTVRASDGTNTVDASVAVNVTDVEEQTAADPDAARAGATDLGDITDLDGTRFPRESLDGGDDRVDYYRFTLTEAKEVGLGLRQQDANADLFLEDAEGTVLHSSVEAGTANEAIWQTLLAGTYYVRVEAQEAGQNDYVFRYGVSAADSDEVTRLERQQQGTNEAPAFAEQSYAFDLAENADGSTNAIVLGTVSATDPENAALTYSIEGGNEAGLFEIDAANGALSYTGAGEDYESGTTSYQLTVRASDGTNTVDASVAVNVTDVEEQTAADPDAARAGATDLGDITDLDGTRSPTDSLDGDGDSVDYYRFTLTAAKKVGLGLRQQDANADLFLEDAAGYVTHSSTGAGTADEAISVTLLAGTYYVRVEAQETGQNDHVFRYGVSTADAAEVTRLEALRAQGPAIRVADAEAHEEDGTIRFRVTLDQASTGTVTVGYATSDGTAVAGSDYESASGTLTFAAGETEKWVAVSLIDDTVEDSGETLTLTLSDPDGGRLVDAAAEGTILNTESVSEPPGEDLPANIGTTGRVSVGGSVTGELKKPGMARDWDWFAVTLEAGKSYVIDILGSATGDGTLRDPHLSVIRDSEGRWVSATTFDDGGVDRNARLAFEPEESGTYYIVVSSSPSYHAVDDEAHGTYRLSVTEIGRDHADDITTHGRVEVNGSVVGAIGRPQDRDWFAVELEAGGTYRIDVKGDISGDGSLYDPLIDGIYDSEGCLFADTWDHDSGYLYNARQYFLAPTDGTYYISAAGTGRDEVGTYELSVEEVM